MAFEWISWIRSSRRSVHFTHGDGRSWWFLYCSPIALKFLSICLVTSCLEEVRIYSTNILAKVKGCFHIFRALRADQCIVLASVFRDLEKKFLDKQQTSQFAANLTLQPDTSWKRSASLRPSNIDFNFTAWSGTKHTRQTSKPYWIDILLFKHQIKRDKMLSRTFLVKFWSETERRQRFGPNESSSNVRLFYDKNQTKGFAKSPVSPCGRFDFSGSHMQSRIVALLPQTSLEMLPKNKTSNANLYAAYPSRLYLYFKNLVFIHNKEFGLISFHQTQIKSKTRKSIDTNFQRTSNFH